MTDTLSGHSGDGHDSQMEWNAEIRGLDYAMISFSSVHHLIMLGVVAHLVWRRDWPPYVTKNVMLVSGLSAHAERPHDPPRKQLHTYGLVSCSPFAQPNTITRAE